MTLTKELFEDVVAYIIAEPGAMGASGELECLKSTGETFCVCYLDEETNWELIKENFEAINGCKFNGPHRDAVYSADVLVFGGGDDIVTTINDGWREICFDCGNHFVCKEEYACGFIELFEGMDGCQIICEGMEKIKKEHFVEKLNSIEKGLLRTENRRKKTMNEYEEIGYESEEAFLEEICGCNDEYTLDDFFDSYDPE